MRLSAILAKAEFGWLWNANDDADLRIEATQDHTGDLDEVVLKTNAELATYSEGQTEITVGLDLQASDPVWGVDLIEGDEVLVDGGWREIEAFTVSRDRDTGRRIVVPQFGTILDPIETRIDRTLRRQVTGLNGGTSRLARPVGSLPQPGVRP